MKGNPINNKRYAVLILVCIALIVTLVVYKINNTIHCCINSINDDSKNIIISSSDPMIDIDTLLSELYDNIFNNK